MNNASNKKHDRGLVRKLKMLEKHHFTGEVKIQALSGLEWRLYLCVGRLIWVASNYHVVRRLYRHLHPECPDLNLKMMTLREGSDFDYGWDYKVIEVFVLRKKIVKEQAQKVVFNIISEAIFDILLSENKELLNYNCFPNDLSESAMGFLTIVNISSLLQSLTQEWVLWKKASMPKISIHLAPKLTKLEELRQTTSPCAYRRLTKLIDGKQTFREIAISLNTDVLSVTRSLYPLIKKGFIQLSNLEDWPRPEPKTQKQRSPQSQPLIACIDDSPKVCWQMEQIINTSGYEAIRIQDPTRALSQIIENPPQLIFLDVVMPVVNGYELCTQLRRVSTLQKIPIIFLSGSIIDRLRAKMVGASGCMTKPIEKDKVLSFIQKYLSPAPSAHQIRKSTPTIQNSNVCVIPQT